jgi:hypothetical protein
MPIKKSPVSNSDLIHVLDAAGNYASDNVEGVLGEIATDKVSFSKISSVNYISSVPSNCYVEETSEWNGDIYISMSGIRFTTLNLSYTYEKIKANIPATEIVTSPKGVVDCIRIKYSRALVYTYSTGIFSFIHPTAVNVNTQIVLAANGIIGRLNGGILVDEWLQKRERDYTEQTKYFYNDDDDLYALSSRVKAVQKPDTLSILFVTDTHIDRYDTVIHDIKRKYIAKYLELTSYCKIDTVVHGGDILSTGYATKTMSLRTIGSFAYYHNSKGNVPVCMLRGNHDDNCYGVITNNVQQVNRTPESIISPQEFFNTFGMPFIDNVVFDSANPQSNYYYIDYPRSKIRSIYLDTNDYPLILEGDGTYRYVTYYSNSFMNAQLNFVADALALSDKEVPSDWAVMFFSHIPLDTTKTDGTRFGITDMVCRNVDVLWSIINAYRDGGSYTASSATGDFPYDVSVDFVSKGAGEVIAFVCGHVHWDNTSDGVGGAAAPEYGYRFISISGERSFGVINVDRATSTISVIKDGGAKLVDPEMLNPPIIGLLAADVNEYGDFTTTYT